MNAKEAIEILEKFNIWRRGADTEMPSPTEIGMALETIISEYDVLNKIVSSNFPHEICYN